MDNEKQTELLIALRSDVQNLVKAFDKVSNGKGFPRCVERGQRISTSTSPGMTFIATISVAVYTYISNNPAH